jgi:sugar phosphate isomerase/epimerase
MTTGSALSRALIASSYMSAGDAAPRRGDGTSPVDLRTRIESVAATGWVGMGLAHPDLVRARDSIGLSGLAAMLADNEIARLELEFIRDWWTAGERRRASDTVRRDLFKAAGVLGVKTIKVGAASGGEPVDRDRFLAEFDRLATEAGEAGARVALEPMCSSDLIPTIREGVDVVRTVGNPHGGLVVDCYHTSRGGIRHSELGDIVPPDSIFIVELADGEFEFVGTMFEAEVNQRRFPGEGEFDPVGFVVAMCDLGYVGPWGVEILSDEYRGLPVREALSRAYRSAVDTIEAAESIVAARPTS